MRRAVTFKLVAALSALIVAGCDSPTSSAPTTVSVGDGDEVQQFEARDAVMNAAIADARASLPAFLNRLDAGTIAPTDSLKVGFPANGGVEHIWVGQIARQGDGLTGILNNEPNWMPGLHRGSSVTFTVDMVSDWSYEHDGKRWGNYTTRVMLPYLTPEEAQAVAATLSAAPTEPAGH